MEINDDLLLTCMPCDLDDKPITGATKGVCSACQCEVWVAPTSVDMIRQCQESGYVATLLCLRCSIGRGIFQSSSKQPLPNQLAELTRELLNE